jgi:YD repeat-containing protein
MCQELPGSTSNHPDLTAANKTTHGANSSMTDREKAGLRGPVQQYTEEQTIPAFENFPATTFNTTTKYSPEGRILQSSASNSIESGPPEFSTTYTYDSAGRLLKKTITSSGSPASESNYNYDENGRIISITGDPLGASTFEYDDQGRKFRIVSPPSQPLVPEGTSFMFPMPEGEDSFLPIPAGGHARISFNEQDQPLEWQVYDANKNLLNRLIRTYDQNGRVAEIRYTIENFLSALPAEAQQQFVAEPGAADRIMEGFTQLLEEQRNFTRVTFNYDDAGRVIEKHRHVGYSMETTTKITYNDRSDKLEEHESTTGDLNSPRHAQSGDRSSPTPFPTQHTRYSYKYDNFGNWTEQRVGSLTSPSDVRVTRRIIVYDCGADGSGGRISHSDPHASHPSTFLKRVSAFFRPI